MKKRDLEKMLRRAGCYLKREGSSHSLWINPRTGVVETVPRHTEIKEPLAQKIIIVMNATNFFGRSVMQTLIDDEKIKDLFKKSFAGDL